MKKRKILLFCTGWGADLLHNYSAGINEAMADYNADLYVIMCYPTYVDEESVQKGELNIFNLPVISDFDGAILLGNVLDFKDCFESLVERVKEAGIPCVSTGRTADGIYSVDCDNYPGAHDLAIHLIEKHGVKNPLFVAGQSNNPDSNTRLKALRDALAQHGLSLPSENIFYSKWEPQLAFHFVEDLVTDPEAVMPDAFACANDPLAMSVCQALRDHNIKVPEDVIVTGFDNDYFAQVYDPSICDVDQDFKTLGFQSLKTLMDIIDHKERPYRQRFPSKFIPSESCGCCDVRDFSAMRRALGHEKFSENIDRAIFNRTLANIENNLMSGDAYEDIKKNLVSIYHADHDYTGNSYHIVLDPLYSKTINNPMRKMLSKGYSHKMDVVFSVEHGKIITNEHFDSSAIVPQIDDDGTNRSFLVLPLHEKDQCFGYIVLCDDLDKTVDYNKLFSYVARLSNVLAKYKQNLSMSLLNQRLLELTETDALTHAKNRTAYEAKEKELNTQIRVSKKLRFAIAMFDVNNLKKVNDEFGHDAGDEYIVSCCHLVCKSFKKSPVYRMGGDEFAVILVGEDYDQRAELLEALQNNMKELASDETLSICDKLSVAGGIAEYDPIKDKSVLDVYNRADELMYQNKIQMKGKANVR